MESHMCLKYLHFCLPFASAGTGRAVRAEQRWMDQPTKIVYVLKQGLRPPDFSGQDPEMVKQSVAELSALRYAVDQWRNACNISRCFFSQLCVLSLLSNTLTKKNIVSWDLLTIDRYTVCVICRKAPWIPAYILLYLHRLLTWKPLLENHYLFHLELPLQRVTIKGLKRAFSDPNYPARLEAILTCALGAINGPQEELDPGKAG